ncbi:MAG: YdcF family protein [Candidatus Caldatribacteriaceae bacterium]
MNLIGQKFIRSFLELPGIVITLSFFFFFTRWRKYSFCILIILLYFFSTGLGARILGIYSISITTAPSERAEAIVILGGGILKGKTNEEYNLNTVSIARLMKGYLLFRERKLPVFLSGGKIWGNESQGESQIMKNILLQLGVPEENIVVEDNSRNTWENARFTTELLQKKGITTFYLVSSQSHIKRALFAFAYFYPNSVIIPVSAHATYHQGPFRLEELLPSLEAFSASCTLFHEWWGLLLYRLKAKHLLMK